MWFNRRPNVTLICGRTQSQMLHSNVRQTMTKWYSLMWYPYTFYRQISPFIDELKIHRRGLTQRLECLINLFSERPSAVVLPFENPEIKFTNPDFSDFRSQCLEMTDFVFPSFDHQINAAAEMCLEREVTHLELLNKNRVITTRHSNLSSNGHIVFHLFADKIRHVYYIG